MSNPSTIPVRPETTWSEVRAHDHVMRYRRSGVGPAVLLLHPGEASGALWPELLHVLSSSFRVIVPDLPEGDADAAAWLADLLEGLGFARVAVLAADGFCLPALELALLDADQVSRLVLVPGGRAEETGLDGALATPSRGEDVPILVVRRGLPADEALPLVTHFLAGESGGDPRQRPRGAQGTGGGGPA